VKYKPHKAVLLIYCLTVLKITLWSALVLGDQANPTESCSSWLSVIYSLLAMANMIWTALKHAISRLVKYTPWRSMHICCSQKQRSYQMPHWKPVI